jgi:hypothetical protein
VKLFEAAAASLLGLHDARDVVEATVGIAASMDDAADRRRMLAQLDEICKRAGVMLLPADRALLGAEPQPGA